MQQCQLEDRRPFEYYEELLQLYLVVISNTTRAHPFPVLDMMVALDSRSRRTVPTAEVEPAYRTPWMQRP